MITFELLFKDQSIGLIPENLCANFTYTMRLQSFYAVAKVVLKDATKVMFNKLKIGQYLDIRFYDTENPEIDYRNPMRIRYFDKIPSTQTSLIDSISLDLISDWYYISKVKSQYYFGSAGSIINEVFATDFKDLNYTFDINPSTEPPKSRYQTHERPQAFIKRILPWGLVEGYPLCLYTDHKGTIHLKPWVDFIKNNQFYLATVMGSETYLNSTAADYALGHIQFLTYDVSLNPTYTAKQAIHSIANYYSTEAYPQSTLLFSCEGTGLSDTDKRNIQVDTLSPLKAEITPWWECPYDARAEFIYNNWQVLNQTFKVSATVEMFQLESLQLGNLIRLELPFNPVQNPTTGEELNFAEGGYIIDAVSYIYTGATRNTSVEMFQIRF